MKRFDFEYVEPYCYYLYDRQRSVTRRIATVHDIADVELICRALNERTAHEHDDNIRRQGLQNKA